MEFIKKIRELFDNANTYSSTQPIRVPLLRYPEELKIYMNILDVIGNLNHDFTKTLVRQLEADSRAIAFDPTDFGKDIDAYRIMSFAESGLLELDRTLELAVEDQMAVRIELMETENLYNDLTYQYLEDDKEAILESFDDIEQQKLIGQGRTSASKDIIAGYKVTEEILEAENAIIAKQIQLEKGKKELAEYRNEYFKVMEYDRLKVSASGEISRDKNDTIDIIKRLQKGLDGVKGVQNGTD